MKWSNPAGIGPLLYQIDYCRKTATASTVRVTNELVDHWESDGVARVCAKRPRKAEPGADAGPGAAKRRRLIIITAQ